jgi:hypothetical protein
MKLKIKNPYHTTQYMTINIKSGHLNLQNNRTSKALSQHNPREVPITKPLKSQHLIQQEEFSVVKKRTICFTHRPCGIFLLSIGDTKKVKIQNSALNVARLTFKSLVRSCEISPSLCKPETPFGG